MSLRKHMHADKVGLIVSVVTEWPASRDWLKDDNGSKFGSLHDAVQAIVDVPFPVVPMGCPSPNEDGTCPGHEEGDA